MSAYDDIVLKLKALNLKRICNRFFTTKHPDLVVEIYNATAFLDKDATFKERLYCVLHNITEIQYCPVCGNKRPFHGQSYSWCSDKCRNNSPQKKQRTIDTCIRKYGVDNVRKAKFCKDLIRKIKLEKYGDENYCNVKKIKQTKLEKYGDENYCNGEQISLRWKQKTPEQIKQKTYKMKATKYQKYGDENYVNPDKAKATKYEKYGDANYYDIHKSIETCLKNHGVPFGFCQRNLLTISSLNKRVFKILNRHHIFFISEFYLDHKYFDIKFNNNVLLEINGNFWHANPTMYKSSDILNMPKGLFSAEQIWERDKIKMQLALDNGYTIKYLWEDALDDMTDDEVFIWIKDNCKV